MKTTLEQMIRDFAPNPSIEESIARLTAKFQAIANERDAALRQRDKFHYQMRSLEAQLSEIIIELRKALNSPLGECQSRVRSLLYQISSQEATTMAADAEAIELIAKLGLEGQQKRSVAGWRAQRRNLRTQAAFDCPMG